MAGTKVSDSTKAEASASIIVIAMGEKVLPSTPVKVSSGAKTSRRAISSCAALDGRATDPEAGAKV